MSLKAALAAVAMTGLASPGAAAADLAAPLAPLAFLTGACWKGVFPGSQETDTHCFTAELGGHVVRDVHVVRGAAQPYSGETLYRWNPGTRTITFAYYGSNGVFTEGVVEGTAAGLVFPAEQVSPSGEKTVSRTVWTRDGAGAYRITNETRTATGWTTTRTMQMVRTPPAGP